MWLPSPNSIIFQGWINMSIRSGISSELFTCHLFSLCQSKGLPSYQHLHCYNQLLMHDIHPIITWLPHSCCSLHQAYSWFMNGCSLTNNVSTKDKMEDGGGRFIVGMSVLKCKMLYRVKTDICYRLKEGRSR